MHRRLAYLLAWAVASTVTVSVAWLGIRSVLVAAAPTRTVPLTAVQLRRVAPLTPSPGSTPGPSHNPSVAPAPPRTPVALNGTWDKTGDNFKRSFHTLGGDVDFVTGKDSVQVVSSAAKPGYTVNVTRYGGDSVMVSFFGNRKTSRVWVRWWNGPYAETTESVE